MKKINLFTPFPPDGTSFYRAWGVFNQIARNENLPILFEANNQNKWSDLGQYSLLYMHRPFDQSHENFLKAAKILGVPVWCDWDDDLINIPPHNPVYQDYQNNKTNEIISGADVLTCTTQSLADNYKMNAVVIRNYIPLNDLKYLEPTKKDKFRIFWRGSNTHFRDWYLHKGYFVRFLKDKKDVEFVFMGDCPPDVVMDVNRLVPVKKVKGTDVITYLQFMQLEQQGDVIFHPLEDIPFNRAKSDCAVKESLLNGMLSITPCFNNSEPFCYSNIPDCETRLEEAYKMWKSDYKRMKDFVIDQQEGAKRESKRYYDIRVQLLKTTLGL